MTEMGCSTDEEEEEVAQACATVERHKGKKRKRAQQRQRLQIKVFAPLEHLTREGLYHLLAPTAEGGTLAGASANFETTEGGSSMGTAAGALVGGPHCPPHTQRNAEWG